MKNLLILFFVFYSCKAPDNILEIKPIYIKGEKGEEYSCDFVLFKISNHSNKNYYLSSDSRMIFLDKNNNDITSIIDSLTYNYIIDNQFFSIDNPPFKDENEKTIVTYDAIRSKESFRDKINKQVDSDFKNFILPHFTNKNIQIKDMKAAKLEFTFTRYSNVTFIEKNSSIIISKKIFPTIFKSEKYDTIKVLYDYETIPIIEDYDKTDYFLFPLNYIDSTNNNLIKIPSRYPKKILGKYHLIKKLKSKDTLIIKM